MVCGKQTVGEVISAAALGWPTSSCCRRSGAPGTSQGATLNEPAHERHDHPCMATRPPGHPPSRGADHLWFLSRVSLPILQSCTSSPTSANGATWAGGTRPPAPPKPTPPPTTASTVRGCQRPGLGLFSVSLSPFYFPRHPAPPAPQTSPRALPCSVLLCLQCLKLPMYQMAASCMQVSEDGAGNR